VSRTEPINANADFIDKANKARGNGRRYEVAVCVKASHDRSIRVCRVEIHQKIGDVRPQEGFSSGHDDTPDAKRNQVRPEGRKFLPA